MEVSQEGGQSAPPLPLVLPVRRMRVTHVRRNAKSWPQVALEMYEAATGVRCKALVAYRDACAAGLVARGRVNAPTAQLPAVAEHLSLQDSGKGDGAR